MIFGDVAPTVLQLTQTQGIIAVAVFIFGLGAAWATLKMSVRHIGNSVEKIEKSVQAIQKSISDHKADITGLKVHTQYGIAKSPIVPSDEGKRVLSDSGFDAQYPKLKSRLFAMLDEKNLRTLYDIEQASFVVLKDLTDDPLLDPLKDYAVNHPAESLELILNIGSWVLRDDYAAHKGIKVKHTNTKKPKTE